MTTGHTLPRLLILDDLFGHIVPDGRNENAPIFAGSTCWKT